MERSFPQGECVWASTLRIKRDLSNQMTALGAARTEGGARASWFGALSHILLWPILLSEIPVLEGH